MENGEKFGSWTVLDALPVQHKVLCRCSCGAEKRVNKYNLLSGKSTSCGCLAGPLRARTHGFSSVPEYQIWKAMKARCLNPNHKNYAEYGGRGIAVCERWLNSFESFYADMGERPSKRHSIDRVDTNEGYSPGNCRWATQVEQTRNTRRSSSVTHKGETKTVAEWAESTGIKSTTLYKRVLAGWPADRIIETPARSCNRRR